MSAVVGSIHQDEILTGEAVALDVQPLGLMMRALGAVIDMLIGYAVIIGAFAALFASGVDASVFAIVQISVIVLAFVVIPTAVETITRGRSVGKLVVGGRIVRADGGTTGFRHAFIRALIGVLEIYMTFGGLAFLVGAFTPRSQRLGDLVSGAYCERTRTPRVPENVLVLPPALTGWAQLADAGRLPVRLSRRITQFLAQSPNLMPGARVRIAQQLAAEAAAWVSPVPPVDAETFLRGVAVIRREREARALDIQSERVNTLLGSVR
ncbi:MAG: RDD family protein [Microbacterium sp.]|jgi:uncharacterized RDD family membrane protein YckC|nr:RDD family protein [Microbacterium sp.]